MIDIHLNGESRATDAQDLAKLVEQLALPSKLIAVELNGTVVRRVEWPQTRVSDGDKIEVVHFVGGG